MIYLKNETGEQTIYIPRQERKSEIRDSRQVKTIEISGPGTYEVTPDEGYSCLSKVIIKVI